MPLASAKAGSALENLPLPLHIARRGWDGCPAGGVEIFAAVGVSIHLRTRKATGTSDIRVGGAGALTHAIQSALQARHG